ncbi:MAG TPA: MFS transporter [Candidatus Limnocylindrales bacterium]|nr:MFS transporter [Candidatus Limnocylindrales bacterium]
MSDKTLPPPAQASALPGARLEWAYLHTGFVLIGICMTMLGPVLPYFTHRWNLTDGQAGLFFSTQYFGSFLGTLATSWLLPRWGFSKVISVGYFCFALGVACLGLGPWFFSTMFVAIYGTGYGLASPSVNLRATQLPSSNVAAAVSLLNFSWGIGAVSSPFLVAFFLGHLSLRSLASVLTACFLALALAHFVQQADPAASVEAPPKRSYAVWRATLQPAPWISLALLFFFYVGIEVSVGGWVALDEKRMVGFNAAKMAPAPAFFYGFLLLGRFLLPLALKYFSQRTLSVGGLLLTVAGVALVTLADSPLVLHAGALLAGFGCAPQYPIYVTWLAARFKDDSTWLAGLFFGAAGIGSSMIPWLVGVVASQSDSLRYGFILPLASALLMIPFALRACPGTRNSRPATA